MGTNRPPLTIAAEIATISTAVFGFVLWFYRTMHGASWNRAVTALAAVLAISFTGNVLFWIASRKQAKSVPAKIAEGRTGGEEAALFRHYAAYSKNLANQLERIWHHWHEVGENLSHPLDKKLPIKNVFGAHSREHDVFTIVYNDHLSWMAWEIPEFTDNLPPLGSNVEYLDLLNLLKTHARLLEEGAQEIESQSVQGVKA